MTDVVIEKLERAKQRAEKALCLVPGQPIPEGVTVGHVFVYMQYFTLIEFGILKEDGP